MRPKLGRSLNGQLLALSLGIVLPTLVFVGVLLARFQTSERSRIEDEARGLSRQFAVALDREIVGIQTTLQALATSPSLPSRDFANFYRQLVEVSRAQGINISLRDTSGKALMTTRAPFGEKVAVPSALADTDREAVRTGHASVSDIFTSTVAGTPVFQVVSPAPLGTQPTFLLGASIDVNYLAEVVRREHLPPGWIGALIDGNGVFVARTERHAELAGKSVSPDFRTNATGGDGLYYGHNSDGKSVLVGYARSPVTGWTAAASLPMGMFDAPLRRSLLSLIGLGLFLAAVAVAAALWFASRLKRAFDQLTDAADAIGEGRLTKPVVTPVAEIDAVGSALEKAAQQLKKRAGERDDAEGALRESEERLRLVIEGARDYAIFTTDLSGVIKTWSAGAAAIFGWSADEIIGREAATVFTPEDRAAHRDEEELTTAARNGSAPDKRWHFRRDGTRVYMNGSVHPLPPDAHGQPQGFIKIARDETERLHAELALHELNETLEAKVAERTADRDRMWRLSTDIMLVARFDGTITAVNPAWTALLAWSEEDLVGRSFKEFLHPDDAAQTTSAANRLEGGLKTWHFENRYRHRDGSYRWLSWTAVSDANLIHAVGRDVTEEKASQAALARSEDALRQSQKMEAVGQLTGGIAHDFNNMLAVIIGGLNLLQRRLARGDTNVTRYIDNALDGATRAAALTQRLLAFSRQQPLSPEAIDANRLVAGMTDLLSRTLGERNEVQTVMSAGLWKAKADPSQVENAVLNLAVNARDAMVDGGKLTIETANAYIDGDYARANDVQPGQYVMIAVSDTGSGMTPEVIEKAFDPFFTTKAVGAGTGLGLSQVFGFARQSGGHVKIYSELGHGTNVKIYLPRSYGDVPITRPEKETASVRGGDPREIILVVEDEERVRMFAVEALRDLGYTAIHASKGADAVRMIESGQYVTLLFTDVVMPGMTGRQLADAVLKIRPEMKVLYATGYTRNAVVHNGVLDPGTNLLSKPFTMNQLAAAVRKTIDR